MYFIMKLMGLGNLESFCEFKFVYIEFCWLNGDRWQLLGYKNEIYIIEGKMKMFYM